MKYYVYIMTCSDGTLYTGITNNIDRRLKEHNRGQGSRYTRTRRPVELSYSESFENRSSALKREFAIKRLPRKEKLRLLDKINKKDIQAD
ncbi:MAG: GIY-YIG nuclease family protein [Oscillospiraceae bacterium]|nr:GIY-YIG nuclease family protein [Oscillospiraceae bacterium]